MTERILQENLNYFRMLRGIWGQTYTVFRTCEVNLKQHSYAMLLSQQLMTVYYQQFLKFFQL